MIWVQEHREVIELALSQRMDLRLKDVAKQDLNGISDSSSRKLRVRDL